MRGHAASRQCHVGGSVYPADATGIFNVRFFQDWEDSRQDESRTPGQTGFILEPGF